MRGVEVLALLLLLATASLGGAAAQDITSDTQDELCFNQLQVLGSHNSYHQSPSAELLGAFGGLAAGPLLAWRYSLPTLTEQLEAGVRAFELDVYWDPQGGLYGQSAGLRIAGQSGWLTAPQYQQPGFKVLHVPDFDYGTSCILLNECLTEIKTWSGHLPIQLHVEVKEGGQVQAMLGEQLTGVLLDILGRSTTEGPTSFVSVPDSTPELFLDLQAELEAAFGGSTAAGGSLLTPDDVRAMVGATEGADLQQLLRASAGSGTCPWPSLSSSMRGKVLVKLIQYSGSTLADMLQQAYPGLKGSTAWVEQNGQKTLAQAIFCSSAAGRLQDDATVFTLALPANASGQVDDMVRAVRDALDQGFIVRARADADTVEARARFTERRDAIIAAGAHVVASDYVLPGFEHKVAAGANASDANTTTSVSSVEQPFNATYSVRLPGGQAGRCLRNISSSGRGLGSGSSTGAVQVYAASGGEDGIYCGPLDDSLASGKAAGVSTVADATQGGIQDPAGQVVIAVGEAGGAAVPQPQAVQQEPSAGGGARRAPLAHTALLSAAAATLAAAAAVGVM